MSLIAWGVAGQEDWQLRATLFWLKALFGLLSMPFLVFKIPVLSTLLMQVRPTGYDKKGRVVLHTRPRPIENNLKFPSSPLSVEGRFERQHSLDEGDLYASLSDDEAEISGSNNISQSEHAERSS